MGRGLAVAALPVAGLAFIALMVMGPGRGLQSSERIRVSGLTSTTLQDAIDNFEIGRQYYSFCKTIEVPADNEEFFDLARAPADMTITAVWCKVTNGTSVAFDIEIDDGSPLALNGSDIVCNTSGVEDTAFVNSADWDEGWMLDADLGAVVGDVDLFTFCAEATFD